MTRGTIFLVADDGIYSSVEFNGDMYPQYKGGIILTSLKYVDDVDSFNTLISNFNDGCFKYEYGSEVSKVSDNINELYFDFSDYFKNFFSDYLYILNISGQDIEYIDDKGNSKMIYNDTIAGFYFGKRINVDKYLHMEDDVEELMESKGLTDSELESKIIKLCDRIEEFSQGYDPYEYADASWDYEDEPLNKPEDFYDKKYVKGLIEWLEKIIEDEEIDGGSKEKIREECIRLYGDDVYDLLDEVKFIYNHI